MFTPLSRSRSRATRRSCPTPVRGRRPGSQKPAPVLRVPDYRVHHEPCRWPTPLPCRLSSVAVVSFAAARPMPACLARCSATQCKQLRHVAWRSLPGWGENRPIKPSRCCQSPRHLPQSGVNLIAVLLQTSIAPVLRSSATVSVRVNDRLARGGVFVEDGSHEFQALRLEALYLDSRQPGS